MTDQSPTTDDTPAADSEEGDDSDSLINVETLAAEFDDRGHLSVNVDIPDAESETRLLNGKTAVELFTLVGVVMAEDPGVTGKDVLRTSASIGKELSPGTVYPQLHDLEDAGVIEPHEMVRAKHYSITDPDAADERLARIEDRLLFLARLTATTRQSLADQQAAEEPENGV